MKKVICGFECELDFSEEWSDCIVVKGDYSGSLQFLESYGYLENFKDERQIEVSELVISKIRSWAEANGY